MAEELQIPGAGTTAKIRNPLGVIGLTLITLGIYFFFWWYFINREMKDLGQARGVDIGDRVTLRAIVRLDLGDGTLAVEIPSYPARHRVRTSRKLKAGSALELAGEIVMVPDEERVTVELDNLGGRVTVRADTIAKHDPPKRHPKLFDKRR